MRNSLELLLSAPSRTFDLGEDILANQYRKSMSFLCTKIADSFPGASLLLGAKYEAITMRILSLRVVEYSGPKKDTMCYSSNDARVKVQVYKMYTTGEEREGLQQAEVTPMPHINFDRQWDQ